VYRKKNRIGLLLLPLAAFPVLKAQIIPLDTPEIIRVSVDTATGLAGIEWKASTSPNIEKYEAYYDSAILGQPGWRIAGTVDGDARQYTYTQLDPGTSDWTLSVLAYDTLGNRSNFTDSHSTMHLVAVYDSCNKTMGLTWSSYAGWDELVKYEAYVSVDGAPYTILHPSGTQDTTEMQLNIADNHRYCYFIKAISPTTHSFSNTACRTVTHPLYPSWIDAESASAVGPDSTTGRPTRRTSDRARSDARVRRCMRPRRRAGNARDG